MVSVLISACSPNGMYTGAHSCNNSSVVAMLNNHYGEDNDRCLNCCHADLWAVAVVDYRNDSGLIPLRHESSNYLLACGLAYNGRACLLQSFVIG